MRVTQEADYAIRMCLILDSLGEKTGAATLADLACITPKIALKVLRKLNTAGFVKSYKGVQGNCRKIYLQTLLLTFSTFFCERILT